MCVFQVVLLFPIMALASFRSIPANGRVSKKHSGLSVPWLTPLTLNPVGACTHCTVPCCRHKIAATGLRMEDEEHMRAVLKGATEVNLPPAAGMHFSNFAVKRGWNFKMYGLQIEFLFTPGLKSEGRSKRTYHKMLQELMDNLPDFIATLSQQNWWLLVQEQLDHKREEFA